MNSLCYHIFYDCSIDFKESPEMTLNSLNDLKQSLKDNRSFYNWYKQKFIEKNYDDVNNYIDDCGTKINEIIIKENQEYPILIELRNLTLNRSCCSICIYVSQNSTYKLKSGEFKELFKKKICL